MSTMGLTLEDMTGPDKRVVERRGEQMDTLCAILDDLDPSMKEHCYVSNRTMWHYSMYRKGQDPKDPWIACTIEFSDLDKSDLVDYAKTVQARFFRLGKDRGKIWP